VERTRKSEREKDRKQKKARKSRAAEVISREEAPKRRLDKTKLGADYKESAVWVLLLLRPLHQLKHSTLITSKNSPKALGFRPRLPRSSFCKGL
jgi:hypothetical protein